jgi:hypothetical protein
MLAGPSRSGKSTLVVGLVRAGAPYLSDEVALLRGGVLEPVARPLSLKAGSLQLLGDVTSRIPDGLYDPEIGECWIAPEDLRRSSIGTTCPIRLVVSPSYERGASTQVERPAGRGEAVEVMHAAGSPFDATIGLRIEPGAAGSGLVFRLAVEPSSVPLFIYATVENFAAHMQSWVSDTFEEGLYGWEVTDCVVTMHRCNHGVADGPPSRQGATSPSDFRYLTPIVSMTALRAAGSVVCEPLVTAAVEVPTSSVQRVLTALGRLGASIGEVAATGDETTVEATPTSLDAVELQRALPGLTGGEGVIETAFGGYGRCRRRPPRRPRTMVDPLDRQAYVASLGRRIRKRRCDTVAGDPRSGAQPEPGRIRGGRSFPMSLGHRSGFFRTSWSPLCLLTSSRADDCAATREREARRSEMQFESTTTDGTGVRFLADAPPVTQWSTVVSYGSYAEAQAGVERLVATGFPAWEIEIVGSDLRIVEHVTGRTTAGRAAMAGAGTGAWMGLFIGWLVGLVSPAPAWLGLVLGGLLVGAASGAVVGLIARWFGHGRHSLSSRQDVVASRHDVIALDATSASARSALEMTGPSSR